MSTRDLTNIHINYIIDNGARPWMYDRQLTPEDPHQKQFGGDHESCFCTVANGRGKQLDFDRHGFVLVQQATALSAEDFYISPDKIQSEYYAEMRELIAKETGAAAVAVFTHGVRNEALPEAQNYARGSHVDYTSASAYHLVLETAYKQLEKDGVDFSLYQKGRFLVINAWRNIADTPIVQDHLALLDAQTVVGPDDYIRGDFFRDFSLEQFRLGNRNAAVHRWYYFPDMTNNEVILFKQFDSDTNRPARACFHSSIFDPTAETDAPPRQSIEVRAVAFFPTHEPDTFVVPTPIERTVVSTLCNMLDHSQRWPDSLKQFLLSLPAEQAGWDMFLSAMLQDPEGRMGLKDASPETIEATRRLAIECHYCKRVAVAHRKLTAAASKAK